MQTVSCPGCGAPVEFRSHASVLAVCGYCKTTLAKDAGSVRDIGRMADLLEDYSVIQVGTSGVWGDRAFTVVGRIQLRYDAGLWNEWHLLFDDGTTGWLGDSSGLYTLTTERVLADALPAFGDLQAGEVRRLAGRDFTVAEIRTAQCIAGQGELPFVVGAGWQARVADLRAGADFLTLDYADGEAPRVYAGAGVTLADLKAQLLRDDDTVRAAAGRFRGAVRALSCPSCGSSIDYVPGVTARLVCPSCQAQVAADGATATVLRAADAAERASPTLPLGAQASIAGKSWRLIGYMVRADEEDTRWTEYLLYNPDAGFTWLVETDDGWSRATVLHDWPAYRGGDAMLGKAAYKKLVEYDARVVYVAGAFNWRVAAGDIVRVAEFEYGNTTLAREASAQEVTWSKSQPVPADQVRAWFGKEAAKVAARPPAASGKPNAQAYLLWLLGLNFIPLLVAFRANWLPLLIGAAAIYLPAQFLGHDKDAP